MKHEAILISLLLIVHQSFSQVPPPLRTIMEVEYVGSNYALGTGMVGVGDINNDGKPDFAVSAGNIGQTFIYFGGKGVLDDVPDLTIKGGGLMAKGDLNGDGRMDLVVAGRETLYVYFGKAPSPFAIDTIPDLIIPREASGGGETGFGQSFAVGDINNDCYDDLLVGARSYGLDSGKVYIYMGKITPDGSLDFSAVGDTIRSHFGHIVKIADINGDGILDLAISSDDRRGFHTIDIFYGRIEWAFSQEGYDQRLDSRTGDFSNFSWFDLVDINADNKADICFTYGDSAYFFFGRSDSVHHTPDLVLFNPDKNFYTTFSGPGFDIGDINGDGNRDFAMRLSPGGGGMCLVAYLGESMPGPVAGRCKSFVGSSAFSIVVPLGDVNGDGVNDFGATAPTNPLGNPPQDGYFIIFSGDTNYVTTVSDDVSIPRESRLWQNYPNPFNPATTIEYTLSAPRYVVLTIYDVAGREISQLVNELRAAGAHKVVWDGRTSTGGRAATGVYYYRLVLDGIPQATKKSLLLK